MKKAIFIITVFAAFIAACTEEIELDLPEGKKRIIINGRVTDSLPVYVEIYTTTAYLNENENPTISGAAVKLFEDGTEVAQLTEVPNFPGRYSSAFVGEEGKNYQIEVNIPEGATYFPNTTWRSQPEQMRRVFQPDSMYVEFEEGNVFLEEGYYAYVMFTEPAGTGDHYRVRIWKNDSLFNTQFDLNTFNDDFADGRSFNNQDLPAQIIADELEKGDTLRLEFSSITKRGEDYIALLNEQTSQVGSPFDPAPAPIFGNIYNANNPNELGLGYFFASRVSGIEVSVK